MQHLNNLELMNIDGGGVINVSLPNFDAYIKMFKWIYKTIKSWF